MREINGIRILDNDEDHRAYLPEGLTLPIFEGLHAPYGFRTTEYKGRLMWTPASEDDFLRAEAQKLGIDVSEVPRNGGCSSYPCGGRCGIYDAQFCSAHLQFTPNGAYWYCSCP
jgi:hypothetical protein